MSRGRKKSQSAGDKQQQQQCRSGNDADSIIVEGETEVLIHNQDETVDSAEAGNTSVVTREELVQMLAALEEKDRRARDEMQRILLEAIGKVQVNPTSSIPRPTTARSTTQSSSIPRDTTSRRINMAGLEKLEASVTLQEFNTWRRKWEDHSRLERIASVPREEQRSALRVSLTSAMLQVVERVLGIAPEDDLETDQILDKIAEYIRKKRSVALDRVEFEECRQSQIETFDEYYIRLQRIAECADLCPTCWDERLTTKVITGTRDLETKRKLLALPEFPKLQEAVNICRSEESAAENAPILGRQRTAINKISRYQKNHSASYENGRDGKKICQQCGRKPHPEGEECPAKGRTCENCHKRNHFAYVCRSNAIETDSGGESDGSSPDTVPRIIRSVRVLHAASTRRAPQILDGPEASETAASIRQHRPFACPSASPPGEPEDPGGTHQARDPLAEDVPDEPARDQHPSPGRSQMEKKMPNKLNVFQMF